MEGNAHRRCRGYQHCLFCRWNLAMYCWHDVARCGFDDRGIIHRDQCGNISKRVQSGDSLYSLYPRGVFESGWRAFYRIWPFRFWSLRNFFGWNVSLIAGWFTLGLMILPAIITASEESLRAVPNGLREGSLALGATKWQTIRKNVLPYALPGILTSSILGISRVAGETAPIMFTAAYPFRDEMPWQVAR